MPREEPRLASLRMWVGAAQVDTNIRKLDLRLERGSILK